MPPSTQEIFLEARKLTGPRREHYLLDACRGDASRLQRVRDLLAAESEAGEFLGGEESDFSHPVHAQSGSTQDNRRLTGQPGQIVGRYKLLQKIGEGSFGEVWMAEQLEPIVRRVAVKIIKSHVRSEQVIARFEAERQALAMMDHPNIARILDGGTTDLGRPYFVMELVRGEAITRFCDSQKLSIAERLELFREVCSAVNHAHQKGVIHRDLKPSNVLVTMADGKPTPRVIDFGVAKALHFRLTEKTLFTQFQQVIGTPLYMSPEQADSAGIDIDTRSDIYSLGVLLYELLTGVTPIDSNRLRHLAFLELVRAICEEEPQKPSTRIETLETKASLAACRKLDSKHLSMALRGDLDWIVLKCLAKERTRRYDSANELGEDLRRHLYGEPIRARSGQTRYRLRRLAWRHRRAVASVCFVFLALCAGLAIATYGLFAARRERDRAQELQLVANEQRDLAREREQHAIRLESEAKSHAEDLRHREYARVFQLARESFEQDNIARTKEYLKACAEDLRGLEWYHLKYSADQSSNVIPVQDGIVYSLAMLPETQELISLSETTNWTASEHTGVLQFWGTRDGHHHRAIRLPEDHFFEVAASPDASMIAVGARNTIRLFKTEGMTVLRDLKFFPTLIGFAFADGGEILVAFVYSGEVLVWDVADGSLLGRIQTGEQSYFPGNYWAGRLGVVSGPARDQVMLVKPSFIEVWNVLNGYKVTEWPVAAPSSVALSADRMYVAYGERDAVMVRKLNSQQEPISCRADNLSGRVTSLVFSPDNTLIAFATGTAIRLFNSESGTLVRELHGHDAPVTTLAWASGDFLISGSEDGTMRFWRHLMRDDTLVPGYSRVGDVRRDGQQWFFVEKDAIRVFDQRSSEPVLIFAGHSREIMGAIYSPDGNRIASFANDGIVLVWDASSGIVLASFPHPGPIDAVAFSPDGQYLASSVANKSVYLWDLPRGHNTRILLKHEARITSMQFSPSSSELATASLDGTILIWNIRAEGEPLILRGHLAGVSTIAYEPSGATIASTSNDRTIRIWNASSGEELRRIAVTDQGVGRLQYSKLQYSSDGRRLMNGGVVLDTYLGERLYEIEGWGRALYYFSDGGRIITTVPDWTRTDLAMRIGELAVAPEPGAWVADRFDQLMDSDRVMRAIEQDTEHGEAFRSEAMVFARTRADNPQQLNADSWSVAKLRESSLAEYADALHKAERANALVPQNCRYLNTLGLALYRVGRYEDSLRTMEEAEALARGMSIANRAVKALALSRLGQVKTAREAYESMKYRMQDSQYSLWRGEVDREEWPLIEEARKEFGN